MIYYSAIPIFSPNQNQNDKSGLLLSQAIGGIIEFLL
jgi:hypothetical protein